MSAALNLISKVIETRSLLEVYQLGIKPHHIDGAEKEIWNFIETHYKDHKQTPSADLIYHKFEIRLPDVNDTLEFWAKEILEQALHRDLIELSYKFDKALTDSKPSDAFENIRMFVRQQLDERASNKQSVPFGMMVDELLTDYLDAEAGKMGIPTPWAKMNDWTMGWFPGDVSFISARLGVGKTFLLILIAIAAREHNQKVLFISGEMSRRDIAKRYAAIRAKLPYSALRRGKLDSTLKEKYFKYLNDCRDDLGLEIMDASLGFRSSDVELAIDKTEATLVLVDAAYRVKANQKSLNRMENMAIVADDFKTFATRYQKAITATTQLNRDSTKKKTTGDEDIALSDVVGWNSTNLFALKQSDENKQRAVMEIYPLKVREGENARDPLLINWNMNTMNFSEYQINRPAGGRYGKEEDDDMAW